MNRHVLAIAIALSLGACGNGERTHESPSLRATRLIDLGRAEEAIDLLENELAAHPEEREARLTLASAFAQTANVNFQRLRPVVERAVEYQAHAKKIADDFRDVNGAGSTTVERKLDQVARLSTQVSQFAELTVLLPRLKEADAALVRHAIAILEEGGDARSPSDLLYTVLLRTILLRDLLVVKVYREFTPLRANAIKRGAKCTIDFTSLTQTLKEATEHVVKGSQELATASPKHATDALRAGDGLAAALGALTTGSATLMMTDEVASVASGERDIIENGLGHLIRCEDAKP